MKKSPAHKDMMFRAARESAIRLNEERSRQAKALIKRDGHKTIDEYLAATQARMIARGVQK
ncbi:hypothetical protein AB4090_08310 [Acidithiobacillus sp. IBUN Pt1247-S3]|uniref:hypothetical protein n=1 Tax=Acidithiobacillus sp. IBUN Pt1247-S3 TaxID=3166642 RepID=UPI0034E5AB0C